MGYNIFAIKKFWLQHKRVILVLGAVIFLVLVFLTKNQTIFKKEKNQDIGLDEAAYTTETVGNIIGKDTDGDGMLDWEEGLWGTDPTKKDTDGDGVNDDVEIALLKKADNSASNSSSPTTDLPTPTTETDKFTDNLMTTVAALAQSGSLDESSVEQITTTLTEKMQNVVPKKIYTIKDLNLDNRAGVEIYKVYKKWFTELQIKYPLSLDWEKIMLNAINPDGELNPNAFKQLNPLILNIQNIINEMLKQSTPESLAVNHVMVINKFQKILEDSLDMQKADKDPLIAFVAMAKFTDNFSLLLQYVSNLSSQIENKLNGS